MSSPRATDHRRRHDAAIQFTRTYAPDLTRCVKALLTVLSYQPEQETAASVSQTETAAAKERNDGELPQSYHTPSR